MKSKIYNLCLRINLPLAWILLFLSLLLPLGKCIFLLINCCFHVHYTISLASYSLHVVVLTLLSMLLTISCHMLQRKGELSSRCTLLLCVLAPVSFINMSFCLFFDQHVSVVAGSLINVCIHLYLALRFRKPILSKTLSLFVSLLGLFFLFIPALFGCIVNHFTASTTISSISSPDGKHYAKIVSSDSGALGTEMDVNVESAPVIDVFYFKIQKPSQHLYTGEWAEIDNLSVVWKDSQNLLINGTNYEIR